MAQSCRKRCSTGQRASEPTGPIVLGSGVWIWRVFFLSYFLKIVMKYMFFLFFGCRVWMFWFLNICECALKDLFESFTSESWRR